MSIFSLFLLAISLCFDTFAVSLSGGIETKLRAGTIAKIALVLALAQTLMLVAGWLLGSSVYTYISKVDHWIAFILLAFIGGKMIFESFEKEQSSATNFSSNSVLFIVALATSIDAIAAGVSLAMINLSPTDLLIGAIIVFVVTAAASVTGLLGGKVLGPRIGRRAELVGGIILIGLGIKIVLEHLNII